MEMNFLLIGDAAGRRVNSFVDCLRNLNIDSYKVITWQEFLGGNCDFVQTLKQNTILRIEPPEKDIEIYREILKLGKVDGGLTMGEIEELDFSRYPVVAPRQWYDGFKTLLSSIAEATENNSHKNILCMQHPKEAMRMMDKEKTYDDLAAKVNEYSFCLPPKIETPASYQALRESYGQKVLRCFIKLRYGSGGTGVLAYRNNPRIGQEDLWTSLNFEIRQGKKLFYSSNKVNYVTDKTKIEELIDWVLQNGAHIEEWIPKASFQGKGFDTRVLVIDKKAKYLLTRLSKSPITNLHLGNKRMNSADILSEEQMRVISKAAVDVMKVFPHSLYAGIDIVCSPGYKPYVIDVNPFGDLFHNLLGTPENVHYQEIMKSIEIMRGNDQ